MFGINKLHIGSTENLQAITGCTVLLFDDGARASAEVRGAAPGTREAALLAPEKQMDRIDAILMTGGSAFGLAAATGVMRYLSENQKGYRTPWALVPIVPAGVIFDLNIGAADAFPDEAMGYDVCRLASNDDFRKGSRGAGTGATVGKWSGLQYAMKSGQGVGIASGDSVIVAAVAVVNAMGDVFDMSGKIVAGAVKSGKFLSETQLESDRSFIPPSQGTNTTLVAVVTNSDLSKTELFRLAQRCHDSLARRIIPVHSSYDGDMVFSVATSEVKVPFEKVAPLAMDAVSEAIIDAVRSSESLGGFPALADLRVPR